MKKQLITVQKGFDNFASKLMRFAKLEQSLAVLCLFIPLILILFAGEFKSSISQYANMENNQIYVFLLTLAAMLFIVNGAIYKRSSYNIVLGIALAGVILFPYDKCFYTHYTFAVVFFLGSTIFILLFSKIIKLWFRIVIGVGILLALAAYFIFHIYSLLVAEWVAFGIIAIHYILVSRKRSNNEAK